MTTERVRVGVVGTGVAADFLHLPGLVDHPRAEVVALCGRDPERAGALARKHGVPAVDADWRALLDRAGLDAVVVATPDDLHHPITMAALERGLHVLCEKPLALTAAHARAMYETAERRGVTHMTFFTNRFVPPYLFLRRLLDADAVGRPYHLSLRQLGGGRRGGARGWRADAARSLGVLGDLGVHLVDLARWYVGEVEAVAADAAAVVPHIDAGGAPLPAARAANDAALLLLRFAGGARGVVQVSAVAHTPGRGLERYLGLHGERGTLELDNLGGPFAVRAAGAGDAAFAELPLPADLGGPGDGRPALDQLLAWLRTAPVGARAFVDAIVAGRPVRPSFWDGWRAQEVLEAALRSSASGRWERVAPPPPTS